MTRKKIAFIVSLLIIVFFLAIVGIFVCVGVSKGIIDLTGNSSELGKERKNANGYTNSVSGKWSEGTVTYEGNKYVYNMSVKNYLIMGVDRQGKAQKAPDYVSGGQADAMFILCIDDLNKVVSIIPINRNTMTDISVCDLEGNYYGTFKAQICLQHGYGDGMKGSCQKTADAVSNLFYNVPINGYIAMNMDGMRVLNNMAGGVEVTVLDDLDYESLSVHLVKGETKKLTDDEAYVYLRYRDTGEFGTANERLLREQQYFLSLYSSLKTIAGGNSPKAMEMYDRLSDYVVSNVVFEEIADALLSYDFDETRVYEIPGELVLGKKLEEFNIDKTTLYDVIIKIMYTQK